MSNIIPPSTPNPQLGPATALVQLLTEHPELTGGTGWSISTIIPTLHGHVHEGGMAALAAYADVLGGSVRAVNEYAGPRGERLRRHVLQTIWRDVPVELVVALPVAAEAVSA